MIYPGFDSFAYLGDWEMYTLRKYTSLCWVGYYLNRPGWYPGIKTRLDSMAWGTLPIYCGQQTTNFDARHGIVDGKDAVRVAGQHGFKDATIYIDFEHWDRPGQTEYFSNWARVLCDAGFEPAAYCEIEAVRDICKKLSGVCFFLAVRVGSGRLLEQVTGLNRYAGDPSVKPPAVSVSVGFDIPAPSDLQGLGGNVVAVQRYKEAKLTFAVPDSAWVFGNMKSHVYRKLDNMYVVTIGARKQIDRIDVDFANCSDPSKAWLPV